MDKFKRSPGSTWPGFDWLCVGLEVVLSLRKEPRMTSRGLLPKDGEWCHHSTQHRNISSGETWALPDKCRSHLQANQMLLWA